MFLWIVSSLLRSPGPFIGHDVFSSITNAFTKNVTDAVPASMIIMTIATVKTGRNRPPLLWWDEMIRAVDWNIVILFDGGLPWHGDGGKWPS
jgi:hypothetical protein